MTHNKEMVDRYMAAFRRTDHEQILSCLTDDAFVGSPAISVTRMSEEDNVVVAEGSVRAQRRDGTIMSMAFCDVFEMFDGKIKRLTSCLMEIKWRRIDRRWRER